MCVSGGGCVDVNCISIKLLLKKRKKLCLMRSQCGLLNVYAPQPSSTRSSGRAGGRAGGRAILLCPLTCPPPCSAHTGDSFEVTVIPWHEGTTSLGCHPPSGLFSPHGGRGLVAFRAETVTDSTLFSSRLGLASRSSGAGGRGSRRDRAADEPHVRRGDGGGPLTPSSAPRRPRGKHAGPLHLATASAARKYPLGPSGYAWFNHQRGSRRLPVGSPCAPGPTAPSRGRPPLHRPRHTHPTRPRPLAQGGVGAA